MAVEYQLNLPFDVQFETGYRTGTLNRRRLCQYRFLPLGKLKANLILCCRKRGKHMIY